MLRKEGKIRIPDRWLEYTARGVKVQGTRFIAFKVPLSESFDKVLKKDNRFNLDDLVAEVPRLGIVIDLTNTTRYYDGVDFETQGIMYKKVSIPGHATPPSNLVKRFAAIVTDFLDDNFKNDKLIGVHCTHGVNRTGYMICNYMITHMNFTPEKAMKRFNEARGHEIERENYIESLMGLPELLEKEKEPWRGQIYNTQSENTSKRRNEQRNGNEQKKSRRNGFIESCLLGSDVYGSRRMGRKTNSNDSRYDRDDRTNSRDRYRNRDQQPNHERMRNHEKDYHTYRDDRYNQRNHRDDNKSKRDKHYDRYNSYHTSRYNRKYNSNHIRNSYHDKPSSSRGPRDEFRRFDESSTKARTEPYTNWRQRPRDSSDERYSSRNHSNTRYQH